MNDPTTAEFPLDTFLRLSLIEGFTVDHLRRLRASGGGGLLPGITRTGWDSLLGKAEAALGSAAAGRRAEAVREECEQKKITILPWGADDYPAALRQIRRAPLLLYRSGMPWNGGEGVAIVGSRAPTGPGREFARILSGELAAAGWTIVSGMARGIDAAAHRGALHAGGTTVAVLGCGVDVTYPREHAELRDEILARGTILSEYPPGSPPLPHRFPERNRIVGGVSRGVIVAEAPERSGALITARLALEQGRDVMAVPGNPWFAHTAGSNRLLREGAAPVCSAADVHGVLGRPPAPPGGGIAERLLAALEGEMHVGEIAQAVSLPVRDLLPCLMELELANLVEKHRGDYYKKVSASGG